MVSIIEFNINEDNKLDLMEGRRTNISIFANKKQVGEVTVTINQNTCEVANIFILETFQHNKYATQVIEYLNDRYDISGESLPKDDSIGFWKSMGVNFLGDVEFSINKEESICFELSVKK